MPLSDDYPEMKGWVPAKPDDSAKTPTIPDDTVNSGRFLRAPLPLPLQYSPDSLRQYNRPGLSSFRIAPLPPGGVPAINSAAQGVATKTIQVGQGLLLETNGNVNPNQAILNITAGSNVLVSSDSSGRVTITGFSDTLIHGDPIWEHDPGFVEMRDDFVAQIGGGVGTQQTTGIGQLGWLVTGSTFTLAQGGGQPPYMGNIGWENTTTINQCGFLFMNDNAGGGVYSKASFALLEKPPWKLTWVFKLTGSAQSVGDFDLSQKAIYVGLTGAYHGSISAPSARPDVFIGVRYDTSSTPVKMKVSSVANAAAGTTVYNGTFGGGAANNFVGQNVTITGCTNPVNNGTWNCTVSTATQLTLANPAGVLETAPQSAMARLTSIPVTSVANAAGGNTIYTMTNVNGVNQGQVGGYIGQTFTITGFVTGANNGVFTCIDSSATTLTLNNPSGAAETHAAFATPAQPGQNDSFFTFEAVQNRTYPNVGNRRASANGQIFVTTKKPTPIPASGTGWHRLDMLCTVAGQVTLTLDGLDTATFTIPKITWLNGASGQVSSANGNSRFSPANPAEPTALSTIYLSGGSIATISGLVGGNAPLNGTWTLFDADGQTFRFETPGLSTIGNNSINCTIVGWPSLMPFVTYGNDDSCAGGLVVANARVLVDYFSFIWNPGVGGGTATADPLKARYF